jgi:DNA-binding GntR family transcriptional regulator
MAEMGISDPTWNEGRVSKGTGSKKDRDAGDDVPLDLSDRLNRTTTSNDVARVLRKRILEGRYPVDKFIRQDTIAQELGVSRIPVREALAQLETEGLVVREKYRGALIPRLSLGEIEEIYEMRAMLEPYLIRHAVTNITPEQIAQLKGIVDRSRKTKAMADWAGLNIDFHRTLFAAADKPLALQFLENLLVRADRYLKLQNFRSSTTREESDAQHGQILKLVASGDADAAAAALTKHISWNADDVKKSLNIPGSGS